MLSPNTGICFKEFTFFLALRLLYRKYCLIDGFLASLKRTIRRFQLPLCNQSKQRVREILSSNCNWKFTSMSSTMTRQFVYYYFFASHSPWWLEALNIYLLLFNKMPNNHIMNTYSSLIHHTIFSILFHWSSTVQLQYNKPSGKMDFILYI